MVLPENTPRPWRPLLAGEGGLLLLFESAPFLQEEKPEDGAKGFRGDVLPARAADAGE